MCVYVFSGKRKYKAGTLDSNSQGAFDGNQRGWRGQNVFFRSGVKRSGVDVMF